MDRAFDYGSKGWGFESLRDRVFFEKYDGFDFYKNKSISKKYEIILFFCFESFFEKNNQEKDEGN